MRNRLITIVTLACNAIFDVALAGCITIAAIHFDNSAILTWYALLLLTRQRAKPQRDTEDEE